MLTGGPAPLLDRHETVPERKAVSRKNTRNAGVSAVVAVMPSESLKTYTGPNGKNPQFLGGRGRKVDILA